MMMPRTVIAILPPRFHAKEWPVKSFGKRRRMEPERCRRRSILPQDRLAGSEREAGVPRGYLDRGAVWYAQLLSRETEDASRAFELAQPPGGRSCQPSFLIVSGDRPCSAWPPWRPSSSL